MKYITSLLCLFLLLSCNETEKKEVQNAELSEAEKIAAAHGYDNWEKINEIRFTFNVDRDSTHFERSWTWKPTTDDVSMKMGDVNVAFNRASVDSSSLNADKGFINDKYWLLVPFQLIWDESTTITEVEKQTAPISGEEMRSITILYNAGGYTPGDAYDIYYDDNYMIREWVFRKGNSAEPSMITSFENYKDFNGIKLALDHKKKDENWNLYFTDVELIYQE